MQACAFDVKTGPRSQNMISRPLSFPQERVPLVKLVLLPFQTTTPERKHGADRETKEPLSTGKMSENVTA